MTETTANSKTDDAQEANPNDGGFDAWGPVFGMLSALDNGSLAVTFPDGRTRTLGQPGAEPAAALTIHRSRAIRRAIFGGELGFADAYMNGDWSTPDLTGLFRWAIANEDKVNAALKGGWLARLANRVLHLMRDNHRRGSRRNISYHYDLGNEFYRAWLDETMTYSSAIFDDDTRSLADAQRKKYRTIAERAGLRKGMKVLEIGCGWAGFAEMAAREYGCHVTGLTLSREQLAFGEDRLSKAGLSDRTDLRLVDYRDVAGIFDRIVSIEMFEAVGEKWWDRYFEVVRERLTAGGRAALQIITIEESRFDAYRRGTDFIQRYIFPGGMLPSKSVLAEVVERNGLDIVDSTNFRHSYARTLATWRVRFQEAWPSLRGLGFDDRFRRMWEYYLSYCEAGFTDGAIDVGIYTLEKPAR